MSKVKSVVVSRPDGLVKTVVDCIYPIQDITFNQNQQEGILYGLDKILPRIQAHMARLLVENIHNGQAIITIEIMDIEDNRI